MLHTLLRLIRDLKTIVNFYHKLPGVHSHKFYATRKVKERSANHSNTSSISDVRSREVIYDITRDTIKKSGKGLKF